MMKKINFKNVGTFGHLRSIEKINRLFNFNLLKLTFSTKVKTNIKDIYSKKLSTINNKGRNDNSHLDPVDYLFKDNFSVSNEIYKNYFAILEKLKGLDYSFNEQTFIEVIEFLDVNFEISSEKNFQAIERIFMQNMYRITVSNQSKIILFLCNKILDSVLKYDDNNWIRIISSDMFKNKNTKIPDILKVLLSIEKMINYIKTKESKTNPYKFPKIYLTYLEKISEFINTNVSMENIDDICVFIRMFDLKMTNLFNIKDTVYFKMNDIITTSKNQIEIKNLFVLLTFLILFSENMGVQKTFGIFDSSIKVMNDQIIFMQLNYELLGYSSKSLIDEFSDCLILYCKNFMSILDIEAIKSKLLFSYRNKLKGKDINDWMKELKVLNIIAFDFDYKNSEFWNMIFNKLSLNILDSLDFAEKKKVKKIEYKDKVYNHIADENNEVEHMNSKSSINKIIIIGNLIQIACSVNINIDMFKFVADIVKSHVFPTKNIPLTIEFLFIYCQELYNKKKIKNYEQSQALWECLIESFDTSVQILLKNTSVFSFISEVLYNRKNELNVHHLKIAFEIILKENELRNLNEQIGIRGLMRKKQIDDEIIDDEKIKVIETETEKRIDSKQPKKQEKLTNIEIFIEFYNIIKFKIEGNNDCMSFIGSLFIDLLKKERSFLISSKIKKFYEGLSEKSLSKLKSSILNKINNEIIEKSDSEALMRVILVIYRSKILNILDLEMIMYKCEVNDYKELQSKINGIRNSKK